MLERLKNWTGHILECVPRNSMECCDDDFSYYATDQDPRELPRPEKYPNLELPTQAKKQQNLEDQQLCTKNMVDLSSTTTTLAGGEETLLSTGCNCYNCRELSAGLAECPICLECYKRVGVYACQHCANVICWRCGAKITACPFCRRPVTTPPIRNHAMERLIAKLQLPCSPAIVCRDDKLMKKEIQDNNSSIRNNLDMVKNCLLSEKKCTWKGDVSELATHLEVSHRISVLVGSSITVEIGGFRSKVRASTTKTRQYIVSLASYASLFLCQITLQKKRLRLEFNGTTTAISTNKNGHGPKFGAWLEVCSQTRTMKGIMPISVLNAKATKELLINCDGLLSPWRNSDDKVTITITIRPLN